MTEKPKKNYGPTGSADSYRLHHQGIPKIGDPTSANSRFRSSALRSAFACVLGGLTLSIAFTSAVSAAPILGPDLSSFTVLGASTVTNVPTSTIHGSVGVWSNGGANAITGFLSSPGVAVSDPQVTGGTVQAGTATGTPNAKSAQAQLIAAMTNLLILGPGTLLASNLVGLTLFPGIYTVPAGTTNLSGALILDGQGNANAAWVFQMPSTLITSPNAVVSMVNVGSGAGVYWDVGSSATIDVNTTFLGNILALTSITFDTAATDFCGRALAQTGAVTLDQNSLSASCAGSLAGGAGLGGGLDVTTSPGGGTQVSFLPNVPVSTVPEPSTYLLFGVGLLALLGFRKKIVSNRALATLNDARWMA